MAVIDAVDLVMFVLWAPAAVLVGVGMRVLAPGDKGVLCSIATEAALRRTGAVAYIK